MPRTARTLLTLTLGLAALALPGLARAQGGNYVFDGGTAPQQAQVHAALDASDFDWSLVPGPITIHLTHDGRSEAAPGDIWLDADVLTAGRFAWGIVQHEYAHQVDFALLDNAKRATLEQALGGKDWCYATPGLAHSDYGCERFASTLAWAYWPSGDSAMAPSRIDDESGAMTPKAFRTLLAQLLGFTDPPVRTVAGAIAPATVTPAAPAPAAVPHQAAPLPKGRHAKAPRPTKALATR